MNIPILRRSEHPISRKKISPSALKVLYRLKSKGFWSFLVGGALRDLLRGIAPRDFDVVTNASIPEIRELFRNSKTIGKRFPIVHAYFGGELIEISSLKGEAELSKSELLLADARRRDFTVNAIYYELDHFQVLDPLHALKDLGQRVVISVGDPVERLEEDPVRILRAFKLLTQHGFSLEFGLKQAILASPQSIANLGQGRKYEELTRVLLSSNAVGLIELCFSYGVMRHFWPHGFQLFKALGPSCLLDIQKRIPIHMTRGSYARDTHIFLWISLFARSGLFVPSLRSTEIKRQWESFIHPLGMPFQAPILELLHFVSWLQLHPGPFHLERKPNRGMLRFLEFYTHEFAPELKNRLKKVSHTAFAPSSSTPRKKKTPNPASARRSSRRRRKSSQTKATG